MRKKYVIGDVHGCFHTLLELLSKLEKDCEICFVGDLCDRGLYSKEVIELVIQNKYECILGNHDNYMLMHAKESLENPNLRWYKEDYMGGKETMENYKNSMQTLEKHLSWLETLPNYILKDNYFITHGFGLPYYKNRDLEKAKVGLLKNRISDEKDWGDDWEKDWKDYEIINIFGHTHYDEVVIGKNYYGIDTACVYGGKLTAIELGSMKLISTPLNTKDIK